MAVMSPQEIDRHEKDWRDAVKRHKAAEKAFYEAEEVLAVARAELTKAERERQDEWRKLSHPADHGR